jgi:D,D-heptose 1,7-bisphosphate phosphatase
MKTVIMAGGRGTRISDLFSDIPKPMIPLCGKPILEHQINHLVRAGLTDILIVTGHLGDQIGAYFKDGNGFKANISYYHESEPLGTAGALFQCKKHLSDSFLLINGDLIMDIDFARFIDFHNNKNALATLAAHPNNHPFDSSLLVTGPDSRIIRWINKEENRLYYKNQVSSGIYILTKELLVICKKTIARTFPKTRLVSGKDLEESAKNPFFPLNPSLFSQKLKFWENLDQQKIDLDRDILKPQLDTNRIFAYNTPEYIKDIGTPERYQQVERDMANGNISRRNLSLKQRAVFLDRDGTINKFNGFVTRADDFFLLDGAAEAIRAINDSGYLAIVITNQPVIARGECSLEELEIIHQKMESELGKSGAYLDDIFFCPHHPDRGFPGERPEYKIECECRKPRPGMMLEAAKKYNIELSESWMVGDDVRDILAGKAAGCKTVYISNTKKNQESEENAVKPDFSCNSLKQFANIYIL